MVCTVISILIISGSQADKRTLDNVVLEHTSNIFVRIHQFLEELSKIYNRKLQLDCALVTHEDYVITFAAEV